MVKLPHSARSIYTQIFAFRYGLTAIQCPTLKPYLKAKFAYNLHFYFVLYLFFSVGQLWQVLFTNTNLHYDARFCSFWPNAELAVYVNFPLISTLEPSTGHQGIAQSLWTKEQRKFMLPSESSARENAVAVTAANQVCRLFCYCMFSLVCMFRLNLRCSIGKNEQDHEWGIRSNQSIS